MVEANVSTEESSFKSSCMKTIYIYIYGRCQQRQRLMRWRLAVRGDGGEVKGKATIEWTCRSYNQRSLSLILTCRTTGFIAPVAVA